MNRLAQIIEPAACDIQLIANKISLGFILKQISDGEWGLGKTYFIFTSFIPTKEDGIATHMWAHSFQLTAQGQDSIH